MKNFFRYSISLFSGLAAMFISSPSMAQHRGGQGQGGQNRPQIQNNRPQQSSWGRPQQIQGRPQQQFQHNRGQYEHGVISRTPINYNRGYIGRGFSGHSRGYRGNYYGPSYWGNRGWWGYRNGYWLNNGLYSNLYLPHIGISIGNNLPYGYYPFYWDNDQYFYSDGLYYRNNNSEYYVVEPPLGAEVTIVPNGAQLVSINGHQYYEINGVYYEPVTRDNKTVYIIAGKDGQLDIE